MGDNSMHAGETIAGDETEGYVEAREESEEFLELGEEAEAVADDGKSLQDYTPMAVPDAELDATRLYLGEIGFSPLLTAEEEVY